MFGMKAAERLKELQTKTLLTKGELVELKHLIHLKWKSMSEVVTYRTPDLKEIEAMVQSLQDKDEMQG